MPNESKYRKLIESLFIESKDKESIKRACGFRDYTLNDFSKEPFERRIEAITTTINHIIKAMVLLALDKSKIYTNGREIQKDFLRYLGIPLDEFCNNEDKYKNLLPVGSFSYRQYIDDRKKEQGILTKMNMTRIAITPEKTGYIMTSLGGEMKGFVAYILKKCYELKIDPWELLGCTKSVKGKRASIDSIKIIQYINEGLDTSQEIAKKCGITGGSIHNALKRFEKLGIIEYDYLAVRRGEKKIYKVDKERLEELKKRVDTEEFKKEIKRRNFYFSDWSLLKEALSNISSKDYTSRSDLVKELDRDANRVLLIFSLLRNYGVIREEKYEVGKKSRIRKTPKFEDVYKEIIVPIIEVAKNPQKIKEYKETELTQEEKEGLLEIYSKRKMNWGERAGIVFKLLSEKPEGMTSDEIWEKTGYNKATIANILTNYKPQVYHERDGKWYIRSYNH
ncbi:MAG: winged helix-turn-helix transcriptional regulator [Candidatus Aenigmatarchaeota archaeon]